MLMVKTFAPAMKSISLTSTGAESEIDGWFVVEKVAISLLALGTILGVQLRSVFQSELDGFCFQVALPANESDTAREKKPWQSKIEN